MNGNESRFGPCFYMVQIRDGLKPNALDQNIPRLWGSLALISVLKFSAGSFQQGTKSSEHCFGKFGSRSVLCSCSCSLHWNLELLETSLGGSGEHKIPPTSHPCVQCMSPHGKVVYPISANPQVSFSVVCGHSVKWAGLLLLKGLVHNIEKQVHSNSFIWQVFTVPVPDV